MDLFVVRYVAWSVSGLLLTALCWSLPSWAPGSQVRRRAPARHADECLRARERRTDQVCPRQFKGGDGTIAPEKPTPRSCPSSLRGSAADGCAVRAGGAAPVQFCQDAAFAAFKFSAAVRLTRQGPRPVACWFRVGPVLQAGQLCEQLPNGHRGEICSRLSLWTDCGHGPRPPFFTTDLGLLLNQGLSLCALRLVAGLGRLSARVA